MPLPATEILLGAARDVVAELSDIPLACCNGGTALIDWADGLRGRLKTACAAAERAETKRLVAAPQPPTGRRTVLFDRRTHPL